MESVVKGCIFMMQLVASQLTTSSHQKCTCCLQNAANFGRPGELMLNFVLEYECYWADTLRKVNELFWSLLPSVL